MWIKQTGSTKRKRDDAVTLPSFTQSGVQINQAGVCLRGISSLQAPDPGSQTEWQTAWLQALASALSSDLHGYALLKRTQLIWFIRLQRSRLTRLTPHPTWLKPKRALLLGSPWRGAGPRLAGGRKAAAWASDRHTLRFTQGSRVNTDVAFSENLLSKSTWKPLLTSADAGFGCSLALSRRVHPPLQVKEQDTPARTQLSGADSGVETAAQRSVSGLRFSWSWFAFKINTELRHSQSRICRTRCWWSVTSSRFYRPGHTASDGMRLFLGDFWGRNTSGEVQFLTT